MKNRNAIVKQVEGVESNISKINFALNKGDREQCYSVLENIKDQIDQIKLYIESEPIDGAELN